MELKKGETIMTDASLHLPAAFLHEAFSNRSGVPPDHFELYYRGKRLEGEAALASWGVGKDSTIEVKMRGRGGMLPGRKGSSWSSPVAGIGSAAKAQQEEMTIKHLGEGGHSDLLDYLRNPKRLPVDNETKQHVTGNPTISIFQGKPAQRSHHRIEQPESPIAQRTSTPVAIVHPRNVKWTDKAQMLRLYLETKGVQAKCVQVDEEEAASAATKMASRVAGHAVVVLGAPLLESFARNAAAAASVPPYRSALCERNPNVYTLLDNKEHDVPASVGCAVVAMIPTLVLNGATPVDVEAFVGRHAAASSGRFMLKPSLSAASAGITVADAADVPAMVAGLAQPHVLQPYLVPHTVLTTNLFAVDGAIHSDFWFHVEGPIDPATWKHGMYQRTLLRQEEGGGELAATYVSRAGEKSARAFTEALVSTHTLNGLFEIEFLLARDGSVYFIEVNLLGGIYGCTRDGDMPVVDAVVRPYLRRLGVTVWPTAARAPLLYPDSSLYYPPSEVSCAALRLLREAARGGRRIGR